MKQAFWLFSLTISVPSDERQHVSKQEHVARDYSIHMRLLRLLCDSDSLGHRHWSCDHRWEGGGTVILSKSNCHTLLGQVFSVTTLQHTATTGSYSADHFLYRFQAFMVTQFVYLFVVYLTTLSVAQTI
jgi:hypothetical protein